MDPWLIAVIVLASILVIREASLYFKGTTTGVSSGVGQLILGFITNFIFYIPIALVLFGVIADIISQTFKFSIGSLIGVSALLLNGFIGMFLATKTVSEVVQAVAEAPAAVVSNVANAVSEGNPFISAAPARTPSRAPAVDSDGVPTTNPFRGGGKELSTFPGLENFDNKYAPQNILVTTAIMFYYMIGEWDSGNSQRTIAPGISLLITVASQIGIRYSSGLLDPWWAPLVAIAGGIAAGGIGYGIVKATNKNMLPFIANQSSTSTAGGLSSVEGPPTDATKPADGSKCAEASGDDFVCDLYKNGELITSTVSG